MSQHTAGELAELEAIIQRMYRMADSVEAASIRPQYLGVQNVAHGWVRRIVRTVKAILLLQQNGYAGEVPPLSRSVVEHSVALRWLVSDGNEIMAPLKTNHYTGASRLMEAWKDSATSEVDEQDLLDLLRSLEHDDHSRDHLQQFAHRVALHGTPSDVTIYQGELNMAHATYQSAAMYSTFDQSQQLPEVEDPINYTVFSVGYLYLAMKSYSALFVARPWQRDLAEMRSRLVVIHPEWENTI